MNDKIKLIIKALIIFGLGFFIHNLYENNPSYLTSVFGPVNESVWEHMKLFFTAVILVSIVEIIIKKGNVNENYIFSRVIGVLAMMISMITLYYLVFSITQEENLMITLVLYFISIIIGLIVEKYVSENVHFKNINLIGCIMFLALLFIFIYFTYNPLNVELFRDPLSNSYGIT